MALNFQPSRNPMAFVVEVVLLSGHRAMVSAEAAHGEELTVEAFRHRAQLALGVGIKASTKSCKSFRMQLLWCCTCMCLCDMLFCLSRLWSAASTSSRTEPW